MSDTLYFDGACPLCSKEISKLKKVDRGQLRCVDIGTLENYQNMPNKDAMLRRLHLQTDDGKWLVGLEANIHAWRNTPYAFLWKLLRLPVVFPLASWLYESWARARYKKLRSSRPSEVSDS